MWKLVVVSGRIDDVRKLGDRWRAEVVVGTAKILVVGQPGAGIPVGAVIEGRSVRVVGIVRLAFPSASDRRASLLPRSPADLEIAGSGSTAGGSGAGSSGTGSGAAANTGSGGTSASGSSASSGGTTAVPDVDFADLAGAVGSVVRVGGLVSELAADGFLLDDGSAIGRVRLAGAAVEHLPLIEPGDAVNVVGRVVRDDDESLAVVVEDPAAISLGSDPLAGTSANSSSESASPSAAAGTHADARGTGIGAVSAGLFDDLAGVPGAGAGVASLLAICLASLAVTALRRRHAQRLLAARVAVRLAGFVGEPPTRPAPAPPDAPPAERVASVGHAP